MLRPYLFFLSLSLAFRMLAQSPFQEALDSLNLGSIAYIQPKELVNTNDLVILDAREKVEFEVSHLKNAIWVGYSDFNLDRVNPSLLKDNKTIVVYCSVGARSEDIGEKLVSAGHTNTKNLFGGIFLWKNLGYPVFDQQDKETEKVHAFSKEWGLLLTNGDKVYTTKNDSIERRTN
ncbi:MAG: rhodanese-like domain-containing protein [Bacteroidota bacterium]